MSVYVTQDVMIRSNSGEMQRKFDFSSAEEFGELKFLLSSGQSIASTVPVVRQVLEQMRGFNDDDYVLLIGDPSVMAIVSMAASKYNNGRMKILKWDRRISGYIPMQVDISGKTL